MNIVAPFAVSILLLAPHLPVPAAQDWPQWRGPTLDGSSGAAADYIRLCNGDKDTLTESLDYIQKTAAAILEAIEPSP